MSTAELFRIDTTTGTLWLVGDRLVCRDLEGNLIWRCTAAETLVILMLAKGITKRPRGSDDLYGPGRTLRARNGCITLTGDYWLLLDFPQSANRTSLEIPPTAIDRLKWALREKLGPEELGRRLGYLIWDGKRSWSSSSWPEADQDDEYAEQITAGGIHGTHP